MVTELRRVVTSNNVKHVHTRCTATANEVKQESKDVSYLYSVKQTLNNFLDMFGFAEFNVKYSKDKDADTEYLILTGNDGMHQTLELHIFSCYCDGDHPEGTPPF